MPVDLFSHALLFLGGGGDLQVLIADFVGRGLDAFEAVPRVLMDDTLALDRSMQLSIFWVTSWVLVSRAPSRCSISPVESQVRLARALTSAATTAKPRPWSPARAASMAALSASRLVCSAIARMVPRASLAFYEYWQSQAT
ncbi:hypothetical protein AO259_11820 [Pseudomonas sp. ICMP 564]|jgi:hypothetical protein|nr:hypothetical protein AO259_11820 [Pseudomonas sp. ICMP 564]